MSAHVPTTRQAVAATLILLTLLTGVLTAADIHTSLRLWITLAFVVLAPGWALAAYLPVAEPALTWSVAVSLGIALGILVAQTMVSAGVWYPTGALLILAGLTCAALVHHLVRQSGSSSSPSPWVPR
jgi:uncharacterized membrane protein